MKVAIVGGTGYGALELIRFLNNHPYAQLTTIISHSQSGNKLSSVYPHLREMLNLTMEELDISSLSKSIDLVFFATPSNVSKELIPDFIDQDIRCIDLSGDFRLKSPTDYQQWYHSKPANQAYVDQAVYGLSEIYQEEIKQAKLIANPGCYPTATLLGLMPLMKSDIGNKQSILIDAKTGVSGAGRNPSATTHFAETNDNFKAYKIGEHKHTPEIEQVLQAESGEELNITFTPHLAPMTRGIMSTIYVDLNKEMDTKEMVAIFEDYYKQHPFVRIRPEGEIPATKEVYGSNFCDIGLHVDQRIGKLIIISVIDNLVKGASGQAIQNMNLLHGWDVSSGLNMIPTYP